MRPAVNLAVDNQPGADPQAQHYRQHIVLAPCKPEPAVCDGARRDEYLPEVIENSDRILVMCKGEIAGEIPRAEATEEAIISYAVGANA